MTLYITIKIAENAIALNSVRLPINPKVCFTNFKNNGEIILNKKNVIKVKIKICSKFIIYIYPRKQLIYLGYFLHAYVPFFLRKIEEIYKMSLS